VTSTTERRTAEAAATDAKERLRIAVNAARMGAWIYDVDTKVVHWSEAIEELFGLAPNTFGRTYEDYLALIHPDDRAEVRATIRAAVEGTTDDYTVEHRVLHPDGEERWLEGVGRVFRDDRGRAIRMAGTVVDITRRKESDEQLKRAVRSLRTEEAKVRQFVKHAPVAVAMFDRDMRYIAASARWLVEYQLGDQDLTGRSHYDVFPNLAESWREVHERVLAGAVVRRDEEEVRLGGGRTEWLEWEIRPWFEEDGQIGGVIIYSQLITERKKLEEQLRQSQKMEAIGQLAGGVAHDFNNIVATILMQAESVRGDVVKPEVAKALDEIIASSERAASLIRQLLAFGRRQLMQLSIMNVNELVDDLGSMLGRIVGEHVTMRLELHPAPLYVHADAGMLDQVLVNLVVNARDAMPRGGEVVIRTAEVMLDGEAVRAMPDAAPGRYVALSVHDTGVGIAPGAREHLFEPFYTTKPLGKGTGLGLPMVFGIVKQHHGQVRVDSEPGRGTTFEVLLPASGPPPETTPQPPSVTPQGGPETILVVEDDPILRRSTCAVLRKHGYRILEAGTATDALTLFDTTPEHIHLLLTDVVMPEGMNGLELAAQLTERRPDLRVIYTSGYSPELASKNIELVHGHNFLQKPAQPIVILATIRAALER
jgi:PAS domain S-box-containing protein